MHRMKIRVLMPSVDTPCRLHYTTSVLIDGHLAIDTGGLPYLRTVEEQRQVDHILLTHSHIDHIGGLPIFIDNTYQPTPQCPEIYAGSATWDSLEKHIFNDLIWPNLDRIGGTEAPFYRKHVVDAHRSFTVGKYQVTPIPMEHIVPTLGYLLEEETGNVLFAWDTAPFPEFVKMIDSISNLKAIFLDASFPNKLGWLAEKSQHTTPSQFGRMVEQVPSNVRVIAMHLKPGHHDELIEELQQLNLPNVEVACGEAVYEI
ncbi:MBL fold metallo-hydrolase [Bremerella sp. JC817]|uniref:MBL fold metallo-hydrolase n=1 Tax=Bremerella sp. JC817 TaxID=3231756 RepID=UPI00345A9D9B